MHDAPIGHVRRCSVSAASHTAWPAYRGVRVPTRTLSASVKGFVVSVSDKLLDSVAELLEKEGQSPAPDLTRIRKILGLGLGFSILEIPSMLMAMGISARDQNSQDRAADIFRLASEIAAREITGSEGVVQQARAQKLLGGVYRIQGKYREAEEILRSALELLEGEPDLHMGELVAVCNQLGIVFKYSGKFDEALVFYRRALVALEEAGLLVDPMAAVLFQNLSGLAHSRRDFEAAVEPSRRAVEIRRRALGSDHIDVAGDKAALAAALIEIGDLGEAQELLESSMAIVEGFYGADHYESGIALGNLAALAFKRGEYSKAESIFRRPLWIKEKHLGISHPELAVTLNNLAVLSRRQDDTVSVRSLWERARAALGSSVQGDYPLLLTIQHGLESLQSDEDSA